MSIYKQLLDIIFPSRCVGCGLILSKEDRRNSFCNSCFAEIKVNGKFLCAFCNTKSTDGGTCPFCSKDYYLSQLLSALVYENNVQRAIKEMKYRYIKNIATDLVILMNQSLERQIERGNLAFGQDEVVVPVPLTKLRANKRGFNQAEVLADSVAKNFGLTMQSNVLQRTGLAMPQADLKTKEARIQNAAGLYRCANANLVKGKTVWLVDDLSTTGATLNDCARALKAEGGVIRVVGLVLARGRLEKSTTHTL